MRGISLIPYNTKINFVGLRYLGFALSLLVLIGSFISLGVKGLNYGIDFKGGLLLEVRTPQPADIASLRHQLNQLGLGEVKLQQFGSDRDILVRIETQPGGEGAQQQALEKVRQSLGTQVEFRRTETVGAKVSGELVQNGLFALAFAMVGMLIYIWFRFEWQYGLCGIIALLHDLVAVMGYYSLSGTEFNETAFVALLTTVGYSINDSVVVYDRLRENLRKYKTTPLPEIMNLSTNETLSRTILTSSTTLLALLALYWFGGPVIENFSMPIFMGIAFGTFSSIFVSVNLLYYFDLRRYRHEDEPSIPASV
jgi:preprotein translocase subunit SecF